MTGTEVVFWIMGVALAVLVVYHLRIRSAVHRLTESLRRPDEARRVDLPHRLLTQGSFVNSPARSMSNCGTDRERIARQSIQERITESMLDQFDDGFVVVDGQLETLSANRAATETFARVRGITGRTVIEAFLDHRIAAIVKRSLEEQTKVAETFRLEEYSYRQRGADGTSPHGRIRAAAVPPSTEPKAHG